MLISGILQKDIQRQTKKILYKLPQGNYIVPNFLNVLSFQVGYVPLN